MNFRFSKTGVAALALVIAIGVGVAVKVLPKQAEPLARQIDATSTQSIVDQDIELPEDELDSDLLQSHHDATTLTEIFRQQELLPIMEQWQGKALFIKLDDTQSPPDLRYYYYDSIYQDSNNNKLQDPGDSGFFTPASTVKVSLAALVLEELSAKGLTRQAEYRIANTEQWYSFEEDLRRTLVISDNEATNRLILWLGFDHINNSLTEKEMPLLAINRLMLDRGTLIDSPSFEVRFNNEIIQQPEQAATMEATCYETPRKVGNCASAGNLLKGLIQITHPEYFETGEGFILSMSDREWLISTMSRTPRQEGLDYADDYCRFLTELETQLASNRGKMLSKCGVSLFTNTYTDLSYLETDEGEQYYILLSVVPPRSASDSDITRQMSQIAEAVLPFIP